VFDVEIDVGGLGALLADETLEQKIHFDRVDGCDPEAKTDGAVRRAPTPLAEDLFTLAELYDLPHREEVAPVLKLVNEGEFTLKLGANLGRDDVAIAMARASIGELSKPLIFTSATGDVLFRVDIAELVEGEVATIGDLKGSRDKLWRICEEAGHLYGRSKRVLMISPQQAPPLTERDAMADAGEHILEWPPRGRVVEDLCSADEGHGEFCRGLAEHELLGALLLVPMSRADSV
jgi:hypothetical protein